MPGEQLQSNKLAAVNEPQKGIDSTVSIHMPWIRTCIDKKNKTMNFCNPLNMHDENWDFTK